MKNWIIGVPIFGFEYCDKFVNVTLPRVLECLKGFENKQRKVSWIIHTDRPEDAANWIPGATCIKVPKEFDYSVFVEGHKEVWRRANPGDRVCFLCADLVPSKSAFFFADKVLDSGKKAVIAAGIRTFAPQPPRIGAEAVELLEFSMKYPHKIVSDTFYGTGGSENPTNIYFRKNDSAVLRGFHLHPFAVVKRDTHFRGTVDDDLLEGFTEDEMYVVANREMALVEMSPESKNQRAGCKPFNIDDFKKCYEQKARQMHKHFIKYRIRITGDEDCGDREALAREGLQTL